MLEGVAESGLKGGDPPVLQITGLVLESMELPFTPPPVVDIRSREGNSSGILDIQIRFYTGFCLVVHAAINTDRRKVGIDGIRAESIEKGLIDNFIFNFLQAQKAEMDSPANRHSLHIR